MKICVLQPDYSTSTVDYKNYDPPRDLSRLLPGHEVDHIFLISCIRLNNSAICDTKGMTSL